MSHRGARLTRSDYRSGACCCEGGKRRALIIGINLEISLSENRSRWWRAVRTFSAFCHVIDSYEHMLQLFSSFPVLRALRGDICIKGLRIGSHNYHISSYFLSLTRSRLLRVRNYMGISNNNISVLLNDAISSLVLGQRRSRWFKAKKRFCWIFSLFLLIETRVIPVIISRVEKNG
jgi:hypothetical protein